MTITFSQMSEPNQVGGLGLFQQLGAQLSVVLNCHVLQVQFAAHVCEHWVYLRDCEELAVRLWYYSDGMMRCRHVWRISLFCDCTVSCVLIQIVFSAYWRGDVDSDGGKPAVLFRLHCVAHKTVEANLPCAPHRQRRVLPLPLPYLYHLAPVVLFVHGSVFVDCQQVASSVRGVGGACALSLGSVCVQVGCRLSVSVGVDCVGVCGGSAFDSEGEAGLSVVCVFLGIGVSECFIIMSECFIIISECFIIISECFIIMSEVIVIMSTSLTISHHLLESNTTESIETKPNSENT